jgi:flagellar biosynthesis protein FlhF
VKIKRFVAKDMRTALTQIKEELGADAVIMSNKKIPEGVELMAAIDYAQSTQAQKSSTGPDDFDVKDDTVSLSSNIRQPELMKAKSQSVSTNQRNALSDETTANSLAELLQRQAKVSKHTAQSQTRAHADSVEGMFNKSSTRFGDDSISQQLKSFTDRLQQATPTPKTDPIKLQTSVARDDDFSAGDDLTSHVNRSQLTENAVANDQQIQLLQQEIASIREILQYQVSGLLWQDLAQKDPTRALLIDKLTHLGLSQTLADRIAGYVAPQLSEQQAYQAALSLLAEQINTTNNDIINRGGVVALVGPTGVGKTTSIAKLAARFSQIHGVENVALISTDTFRIQGFEQLSTYGRIIGCPVKLVKDANELANALTEYRNKKLVLIDTAGMGQRDVRLAEHLATLIADSRVRIRHYLVLAANAQQRVLQENVERFKKIPLAGCIFTKLDECLSVGEIISVSVQNGLPIGYLTDGQRVPEDIKVANAKKLVMLANKLAGDISISAAPVWQMNHQRASTTHVV